MNRPSLPKIEIKKMAAMCAFFCKADVLNGQCAFMTP